MKLKLIIYGLCTAVFIQISYGEEEDSGEDKEGAVGGMANFEGSCGMAVDLEKKKTIDLQSPDFNPQKTYAGNISCKYYIIGTAQCIPNLFCELIDIRPSQDCEQDHLRVSDGVGGENIYCGKNLQSSVPLQASLGFRDLFLHFKTGPRNPGDTTQTPIYAGYKCKAVCGSPGVVTGQVLGLNGRAKKVVPCACGIQNTNDRIVGGEDVALREFPWQAALVVPDSRKPFCGGTLINDKFILTAAHCFFFVSAAPEDVEILLFAQVLDFKLNDAGKKLGGSTAKNTSLGIEGSIQGPGWKLGKIIDADEGSIRLKVKRILNHPLFTTEYDYDVALVEIETPIKLRLPASPTPVCLPQLGIHSVKYVGLNATVVGWGKGHETAGSNNRLLQKLTVPVIELAKCKMAMPYNLTRRMVCAGFEEGGKDACTGDSGGPLIVKTKIGSYEQIGVVSWGEGCAREKRPGLYARVAEFNQWIHYETSEVGTRWCRSH